MSLPRDDDPETNMSAAPPSSRFEKLVEKIALELAFAAPGADTGLLPINSFLLELEEAATTTPSPEPISTAIRHAHAWLNRLINTAVLFDQETLKQLGEWHGWMSRAIGQWDQNQPLPPLPPAWKVASVGLSGSPLPDSAPSAEEPSITINLDTDSELLREFVGEGFEHLQNIEQGVLVLEDRPTDAETLNSIFRAFHTFKGGAGFLNLAAIKELAHEAESLLDAARQHRLQVTSQIIDTILAAADALKQFMTELNARQAGKNPGQPIVVPTLALRARIRAALNAPVAAAAASAPGRAELPLRPEIVAAQQRRPTDAVLAEEPSITINLDTDSELLREFVAEGLEHLQNIEQGVLILETRPTDAETLNSIFRAFHTFKGGAGFLNLAAIKELAHESESLLDAARQHRLQVTSEIINLILAAADALKQFMVELTAQQAGKGAGEPIVVPTLNVRSRLRAATPGSSAAIPPGRAELPLRPDIGAAQQRRPTDAAAPPPAPLPPIASSPPVVARAAVPPAKATPAERPKAPAPAGSGAAGFIKVDTIKLDGLIDQVGELMIAQSMVVQDPGVRDLQSQQLTRNLAQLRRITNELQRTSMSLRMVPIRGAFQKMIRLVRDTAALQKKQVQLLLNGEDTEMDRNIVEEIADPLIHMIRNSVDHGIELPADRVAKGKRPEGTIHLRAFHKGGSIVIQIEDDGAGLNKDRIVAKALEKGMIKPGEQISESEIFNLIFAPGFSTAQKVTEISGRGVGMDVVQRNIEKLRGKVEIGSVLGQGSTFTIYLPLTLAIIDGLIVSTGSQRYILPTLSVRESFRPKPSMISTLYERGEMVNVRGRLTPLLRLYQLFNTRPKTTDPSSAIVIVLESGQDTRCLMVDELIGKQEVVIKSLGESFKANRALAGAAILGDGRVGLILDVDSLVKIRTMAPAMAA